MGAYDQVPGNNGDWVYGMVSGKRGNQVLGASGKRGDYVLVVPKYK